MPLSALYLKWYNKSLIKAYDKHFYSVYCKQYLVFHVIEKPLIHREIQIL